MNWSTYKTVFKEGVLSACQKIPMTKENIEKYKSKAKYLSSFKTGNDYDGYIWIYNDEPVGACNVRKSDNYIQAVVVTDEYKRQGLGKEILDVCTKELEGNKISVNKKNEAAYKMYSKYGFKVDYEDNSMRYMTLGGVSFKNETVNQLIWEDFINEEKLDTEDRNAMKDSTFGLPEKRKYPLNDEQHVRSAIVYFNKCDPEDEEELARNIKKAMKKYNMDVNVSPENRFSKYYKNK